MRIFVRTLSGRTITLDVDLEDKISSVKEKIELKEGIMVSLNNLLFSGRQLMNDKTLSYYEITENDTLFAILRMR